jgi:hypothetical protein
MPKKQTSVYRRILKKAWQITWQNKFLWLFGFLAALIGNVSIYETLIKGFLKISEVGQVPQHDVWAAILISLNEIQNYSAANPFVLFLFSTLLLGCFILIGLAIWLAINSRGALIDCVFKINKKEKINLKEGWTSGKKFFWQILGFNILSRCLIVALLFLITIPALLILGESGGPLWQNLLLYFVSFVFFTALALIVSLMAIYASSFVVIKNYKFFDAIRESWNLFIKNWLTSLEMALILFLVSLGAGIAFIFFSVLISVPFALFLISFYYLDLQLAFFVTFLLVLLVWLCLLILVGSALVTFQFSSWTLLFVELTKKKILSKLFRFIGMKK